MALSASHQVQIFLEKNSNIKSALSTKTNMNVLNKLANDASFDQMFEMVKRVVEKQKGLHRAGLTLLLGNLPSNIAAYYPIGSNYIVLNKYLVKKIHQVAKSNLEFNSFVYTVLMHEYLHSLGFLDESEVRGLVENIVSSEFGRESIIYEQAVSNWLEKYPELNIPIKQENVLKTIRDFDTGSQPFIG